MGKKYTTDGKPRKSGIGKLFLGVFLGIFIGWGIIFGVGWFAYNNVSANWLNKTFKTDIDFGSNDLNKKTLSDVVPTALSVAQNIDSYTLNDAKNDFGIDVGDKLMGIDITDLKDVPIKDISTKAQDKFSKISADELKDVVDLTDMNKILNKTNTYYVSGDKLYKDADHTVEVDKDVIDYTLTSTTVEIKGQTRNIQDGKVEFELRYLPLTTALGDFTNDMGEKITVGELVDDYGVNLPTYLHDTDEKRAKTINELTDVVDNLYLAEFLGYTISGDTVTKNGKAITGIVAKLAKKKINELNNIETIINDSTIAEVLDYSYEGGKYYYINSEGAKTEVTGIMKALAGTQIKNLTEKVDNITLLEALDYTVYTKTDGTKGYRDSNGQEITGVLTLLDLSKTTISTMNDDFQEVIEDSTISTLVNAGVIKDVSADDLTKTIPSTVPTYGGRELGSLKIKEAVNVLIALCVSE